VDWHVGWGEWETHRGYGPGVVKRIRIGMFVETSEENRETLFLNFTIRFSFFV
jgi:hypothetical protein